MQSRQQYYLQEMGVQIWRLERPGSLLNGPCIRFDIESSCRLLFISPVFPQADEAILFEKVLTSFHVPVRAARHIFPQDLYRLGKHQLEWVWFAGCSSDTASLIEHLSGGGHEPKSLVSPLLSRIDGHPVYRRELWQQICRYQESES
jgi:DNA polymerase-3 subunit psi